MALYQLATLAILALSQAPSLQDLEKRAAALNADQTWTPAKNESKAQLNQDLSKLVEADTLKTAEEFWRAAKVVQYGRGALPEARLRYELTITAMALGDADAAKQVKMNWDQFLLATGRLQHLGSIPAFKGMQADRYAVNLAPDCVQTVLGNPAKAKTDAAGLKPNDHIRKLVEEDQKVRQSDWSKLTSAQLEAISKADDERRGQLKSMLKGIKLMTAQDYQDAALVMQHGAWFNDYALAHELALCATILDPKIGRQMVALSYDRMLESGGYQQRVGTQYHENGLAPVDSVGFNDTMRKALGRKPLSEVPKKFG
jgi:hypothetical protein